MTIRGFLMWYVGVVLFLGLYGASAYRALERPRAQQVAQARMEPPAVAPSTASQAVADPQPPRAVATADTPLILPPPTKPAARPSAVASAHRLPPLRQHVAAATHSAATHSAVPRKLAAKRFPGTITATTYGPVRHPSVPNPDVLYAQPRQPPPPVPYYAYSGYYPYAPGYPYGPAYVYRGYYPRYPYYRAY